MGVAMEMGYDITVALNAHLKAANGSRLARVQRAASAKYECCERRKRRFCYIFRACIKHDDCAAALHGDYHAAESGLLARVEGGESACFWALDRELNRDGGGRRLAR